MAKSKESSLWYCVARLACRPAELEERADLAFEDSQDAAGHTREATVGNDQGQRYWLVFHPDASGAGAGIEMRIRHDAGDPAILLDAGLQVLGLSSKDLSWIHPDAELVPWAVWRQDDHGNRFLVTVARCRSDAARLADAYEAKGHKQLYWIEQAQVADVDEESP